MVDFTNLAQTYFVADISGNHDGDLDRALILIELAKESGADAAKFQHFRAAHIVSCYGFSKLGKLGNQAEWKDDVVSVYEKHSIPWEWTPILAEHCNKVGIDFFSTPYDLETVDHLDPYVSCYKIGSGDITWLEEIQYVAKKGKPVMLATGMSYTDEVVRAMDVLKRYQVPIVLMQCTSNYTGDDDNNIKNSNLDTLQTFRWMYPDVTLGLSDHTLTDAVVLGAVALGAEVIEKHFTDDNTLEGPDHKFSLEPFEWEMMVRLVRQLEQAMGDGIKRPQPNEVESRIMFRRCVRARYNLGVGEVILRDNLDVLRPAPVGSIAPYDIDKLVGRVLNKDVVAGQHLVWGMVG